MTNKITKESSFYQESRQGELQRQGEWGGVF